MSDLDLVLQELKRCGEGIARVSEELAEIFSRPADAGEKKTAKAGKGKTEKKAAAAEDAAAKEEAVPEEGPAEEYSLTEVRALLAEKSRAGYTAEIRALLLKHGAEKLSGIDPSEYAALAAEAGVLGNG